MARNFLETETEFQSELKTFNIFLKKVGNNNFSATKSSVITRNTETRDNKLRVLKTTPNKHKYKQISA